MANSRTWTDKIAECEAIIGYTFNDELLCVNALNAAGDARAVIDIGGKLVRLEKNDHLAILGDQLAAAELCKLWIVRDLDKRYWTELRNEILSNEKLSELALKFGLDKCITTNGGTTSTSVKLRATAVEAILGAVELDGGNDALKIVMAKLGLTTHHLITFHYSRGTANV